MLTAEQFQQVERYIAGKGIRYYDVRLEIADHLSEQVMAAMQKDGSEFETALREQGALFEKDWPLLVEYKTRYIRLKILLAFRKEIFRFFTWPGIGITFLMTTGLFALGKSPHFTRYFNDYPEAVFISLIPISYLYLKNDWRKVTHWREHNLWRKLLAEKQLALLSRRLLLFQVLLVLFVVADITWWTPGNRISPAPPTLLNQALFYTYPLALMFTLAWKRACVGMYKTIHKNYEPVMTEGSVEEILASYKKLP